MRIARAQIKNFRGIQEGRVDFDGNTLLVGGNSIGKSTVCEALDLVLGPERMYRRPVGLLCRMCGSCSAWECGSVSAEGEHEQGDEGVGVFEAEGHAGA